jgi:hypothetical protein
VFFIDRCSLSEKEGSGIVFVSLNGTLACRKPLENMLVLYEVKQFLRNQQPSIILLFDSQFPFSK